MDAFWLPILVFVPCFIRSCVRRGSATRERGTMMPVVRPGLCFSSWKARRVEHCGVHLPTIFLKLRDRDSLCLDTLNDDSYDCP